jgi:rubrerythrin
MGLFDRLTGGSTDDEARIVRFNCRACSTNFDHDETGDADPECPECGETNRVYRV